MSTPTRSAFEHIVERVTEVTGQTPRGGGRQYQARCPAHDDQHASLSVTAGEQRVLLKCHAGCAVEDILSALGLALPDLFDEPRKPAPNGATVAVVAAHTPNGEWIPCTADGHHALAAYEYRDETGGLLYTVIRCDHKEFPAWRPDASSRSGRRWKLGDTRRVLYRLPEVVAGVAAGRRIWVTEGEKDADVLAGLGEVATCNPHGAGKWRGDYARTLTGANVTVVADKDDAGRNHAAEVATSLRNARCQVTVVEAMHGKDVSDHLAAGYTIDQLVVVDEEEPDTWAPIDLAPYVAGEVVQVTPTLGMARSDGIHLLYPGKEHAVIGEMESGKSWFALGCCVAELQAGRRVVYIHFEETDPSDTVVRLQQLGVSDEMILTWFTFVGPEQPVNSERLGNLIALRPTLVILDGMNEAMALHSHAIREEDGVANFRRQLIKPFTRINAAVLACDHVVKDKEARDRYGLGSVHKANALNGVLLLMVNVEPFGRGQKGKSRLYVTKDRNGFLRRFGINDRQMAGKTYMGDFVLNSQEFGRLTINLFAPAIRPDDGEDDGERGVTVEDVEDDRVYDAIKALHDADPPILANFRNVRAQARLGQGKVDAALSRLLIARRVTETTGPNKMRLFGVTEDQDSGGES